jgi:glycosyltransferase involved in cell wall biosynthesis
MENRHGVSVIIPLYNKAGTVRRAIDSALMQSGVDVEVIVIDDGSTDGSAERVGIYGNRIVFRHQPNAGPSAARNRGAKLARHSLLAFLDADDEYLPGCLSAHAFCRRERPDTEISLGSFLVMQGGEAHRDEKPSERVGEGSAGERFVFVRHPSPAGVINVHVGAICVNRDLFDAVGGFDPDLQCWEVTELLYRLSIAGSRACLIRECGLVVHSIPENSQFQRMHKIPAHAEKFAHRLLARIGELPAPERTVFTHQIRELAYGLWDGGALEEFKRVVARARRVDGLLDSANWVRLTGLGAVPLPILRVLWQLRTGRVGKRLQIRTGQARLRPASATRQP